jgi:transcriptional regulator with XRE-family HTH domain
MDDVAIGNALRVIRIRKRLRQADVARRAGVRREVVSRLERGGLGRLQLDVVRDVARALGARTEIRIRFQGAELDRVVNAAHADLHESVARFLASRPGWEWRPEVSFSIFGERGVIDILAWHAASRSLLIIELKTELVDPQALVASMGQRVRLAPQIAKRLGWLPASVSCWVIATDTSTNRRRRARHGALLGVAFPFDGRAMRRWIGSPSGRVAGLGFWSDVRRGPARRTVSQTLRVRMPPTEVGHAHGSARGDASIRLRSPAAAERPPNGPTADK